MLAAICILAPGPKGGSLVLLSMFYTKLWKEKRKGGEGSMTVILQQPCHSC